MAGNTDNSKCHVNDKKSRRKRGAIITAYSLAALLLLIVVALTSVTLYLTPNRLTDIINREASKNLNANVSAHNVRFTIWSTFPHFCIEADSLEIVSRSLGKLSAEQKKALPENPDYLLSTGFMRGGINIVKLIAGKIQLHNLEINNLNLNIVALNDSINNYNILPSGSGPDHIPYFSVNSLKVNNAGKISYFSAATEARLNIDLADVEMSETNDRKNAYSLMLLGKMSATVGKLPLLDNFPFELDGSLTLNFKPFAINLNNYTVNLGGTHGRLNLDMQLDDNPSIRALDIHLNPLNLSRLAEYLPGIDLPYLSDIHADINVDASARLIAPYRFSSTSLPSLDVDFKVEDGLLSYTINNRESYSMTHRGLEGHLFFDGKNPDNSYFDIPTFSLSGEGVDLRIAARATDLSGKTLVTAKINADANLRTAGRLVKYLTQFRPEGRLSGVSDFSFRFDSDARQSIIKDMTANGSVRISDMAFRCKPVNLAANANSIDIHFNGNVASISSDELYNARLNLDAKGKGVDIDYNLYNIKSSSISLSSKMSNVIRMVFDGDSTLIPLDIDIRDLALNVSNPDDTIRVDASGLNLSGTFSAAPKMKKADNISLRLTGKRLDFSKNNLSISLDNVSSIFSARSISNNPLPLGHYTPSRKWYADSADVAVRPHSELFLTAKAPEKLADLMQTWRVASHFRAAKARMISNAFPLTTYFSDIDMEASFDSLIVHNIDARTGTTALRMNGKAGNLRRFLNSTSPQPLPISLNLICDTIGINQLAHAYEDGLVRKKGSAALIIQKPDSISAQDTIAAMIPRNIIADINASVMETRYMDLRLRDIAAGIKIKDGNLNIDTLRISSDFGSAGLNLNYNTADIINMGINTDINVHQIDIVNFFRNFHTLLLMMPQMKNLSGNISASCSGSLDIFPNMYADVPSLFADMYIHGWGLKVHQNKFIRKITKMMLIRTSDDIHIADMNVHASVHDNLLELYPFDFSFNRYKLNLGGLNNFNGKLYYHIGIDKSPVPFPFGINITGQFHDPELRFGGASYKMKKGEEITSSVMENNTFNLLMELKYYLRVFIHKAAESDSPKNP